MVYAILFGLGPAGLFLGRQLAQSNIKVIGVGRHDDIGLYSKHVEGHIGETTASVIDIVEKTLLRSDAKPMGYICSDQYLTMIIETCPELFDMLDFGDVGLDTLKVINSKRKMNDLCKRTGIVTPDMYEYSEITKGKNVELPLVFKLESKRIGAEADPIGKIQVVHDHCELSELIGQITVSTISKDDIIVQEYIGGTNASQFSFGGYFRNGIERAGIVVNQIRQYPQGVSSLVIETDDEDLEGELRRRTTDLAEALDYSGFLEVEFKVRNGQIYLMDVNPRPWGWVSILSKKFEPFNRLLVDDSASVKKNENRLVWKSPIRDIVGYMKNPQNVKGWRKAFTGKYSRKDIAYDIHDPKDIRPTCAIIRVGITKVQKGLR